MRKLFSLFLFALMLLGATPALAIGTGSGGYVPPAPRPSCSADTWACGQYGVCSPSGVKTRRCEMTYDCPSVVTPSPATSAPCRPSSVTPPSTGSGADNPSSRPAQVVPSTPSNTGAPAAQIRCGNLGTARERIRCRLLLTHEELVAEQQLMYLPEECRLFAEDAARDSCTMRYKSFAPCWNSPAGEARFACARQALQLQRGVSAEAKVCSSIISIDDKRDCVEELRAKVLNSIKFRFYDLEKRAEDLLGRGASTDEVAAFIDFITQQKLAFNAAQTDAERREVILKVRARWKEFLSKVTK